MSIPLIQVFARKLVKFRPIPYAPKKILHREYHVSWMNNGNENERLFTHLYFQLFFLGSGEEFAGAPLMCQHMDSWYLAGILAWRKGCSTVGQRPRLYDRVAVTSQWAHKVMLKLNDRIPRHNH